MKAKAKGTRNERRSMALFEACGFKCVRAAGSNGVWDFVAYSPGSVVFVQVKTNAWPSALEVERMESEAVPQNATRLIHRWDDRDGLPKVRVVK